MVLLSIGDTLFFITILVIVLSSSAKNIYRQCTGLVIEYLTRDLGAVDSSLTSVTKFCHSARHIENIRTKSNKQNNQNHTFPIFSTVHVRKRENL